MQHAADLLTRWPALQVAAKRDRLRHGLRVSPGPIANRVRADTGSAQRAASAMWRHEPSAWSASPEVQATIANRLGWLTSPGPMADSLDRLRGFADGIKGDGFTDVVLLGMGSSLAPEVLRAIVGTAPGRPRFRMLDSRDPDAIRAAATPRQTLYLLASKSARRSSRTRSPRISAACWKTRASRGGRIISSRSPTTVPN
jgi:glucose-6-phosphate isomerase